MLVMININTKQAFSAIKSLWNHLGEREKKKSTSKNEMGTP